MKKIAYFSLLVSILIAVIQLVLHYSVLPERVASHFDAAGQPNGFSSKDEVTAIMLGLVLGLPALMVALARLMRVLPKGLINIPHREYWLHEERAAATYNDLEVSLVWLAVIEEWFFIGLAQLTFTANMRGTGISPVGFGLLMLVIFVSVGAFCIRQVRKYGQKNILP